MVRGLIDFALNNRFLVTVAAFLLLIWGAILFHNLPVEAYPDVANNYVQVITQWLGHGAEEVEQQVTISVAEPAYRASAASRSSSARAITSSIELT